MAAAPQQDASASYEDFLAATPSLKELTENIDVGTQWYILGIMLAVDQTRLNSIEDMKRDDVYKTTKMFELWLRGNSKASRSQVLEALRKRVVGEATIAMNYEKNLRKLHYKLTFQHVETSDSKHTTEIDNNNEGVDLYVSQGHHDHKQLQVCKPLIKGDKQKNDQPSESGISAQEIERLQATIKEQVAALKEKDATIKALTQEKNKFEKLLNVDVLVPSQKDGRMSPLGHKGESESLCSQSYDEEEKESLDLTKQVWLTSPSPEDCRKTIADMSEYSKVVVLRRASPIIVPHLIQLLKERAIEEFHIISTPVQHHFIYAFSNLLTDHPSLHWLRFTSNSISDKEVVLLANIIKHNTTLTHLSLSENPYITTACAQSLADLIVTNRTLTYLSLRSTNINNVGIELLMTALRGNKELNELKLDNKHEKICSSLPSYRRLSFCSF